jgi:capsular exopolysaccharide synthesis family protein
MVIERALEKLKQAAAEKTARPVTRASVSGASPVRKRERAEQAELAEPATPRPDFVHLSCDRAVATQYRIVVPGTQLAADEGVGAAYRIIRTRLLQRMQASNWSVLGITSPEAGEGKSVTAINLALNLARDGTNSVFLIDLDMRSPSVCRYLGVDPAHDLVGYFSGASEPQDVFFNIGVDNLAIAGNMASSSLASELLAGDRLEELLDYVRSVASNPLILIDLPPLLVTDEALLVAPRVDATLMVVSEGTTRRDSLLRAKAMLGDFPFGGVILNKSTESLGRSGYYYGYGTK